MTLQQEDRLKAQIDVHENGCWHWQGTLDKDGYGKVCINYERHRTHRLAYKLYVGELIAGLVIDHTCHNDSDCTAGSACMHRRCINPEHLRQVTARTNTLAGRTPAALNTAKTHCLKGHRFEGYNLVMHGAKRGCRECSRLARDTVERKARAAEATKRWRQNPDNQLKEREAMRKRRETPEYKAYELAYSKEYEAKRPKR